MTGTGKCTSWLGHHFEARYSSEPIDGARPAFKAEGAVAIEAHVLLNTNRTYERDVCVRCGATIEKHIEVSGSPQPLTP